MILWVLLLTMDFSRHASKTSGNAKLVCPLSRKVSIAGISMVDRLLNSGQNVPVEGHSLVRGNFRCRSTVMAMCLSKV